MLPQVRDYVLNLIRTACEEYDIDGVDLGFFRHSAFFKSSVEGLK